VSALVFTAKRGLSLLGDEKGAWMVGTTAETLVGSELCSDTGYDTPADWNDTGTGWSVSGSQATSDGSSGSLENDAASGLVPGTTYIAEIEIISRVSGNLYLPYDGSGDNINAQNTVGVHTHTFVAVTAAVPRIHSNSFNGVVDNFKIRKAVPDLSINNNGLGVYGSVVKSAVATGADLMAYSGFSASNYLEQPYNSDLDPGTGEIRIKFALKESANSAIETIYERDSIATAQRVTVEIDASGYLVFTCDDGTTVRSVTSTDIVDDDVWRDYECLYSAGTLYLYINDALNNTATGTALLTLTNTAAVVRWGLSVADTNPLTNGSLTLCLVSLVASTAAQILTRYNDEKHLFKKHSYYTQKDISYTLALGLQNASPETITQKTDNFSLGGGSESIVDRDDEEWSMTTGLVHRTDNTYLRLSELQTFEHATRGLEPFTLDIHDESEPTSLIRIGNRVNHQRESQSSWFRASYRVREQ
jgi:uncharacterized membrane protein YidH (DUF202 family)